jgi:uncharacterized protein (TIGR02001 family)
MARRNREVGVIKSCVLKSCVLAATLVAGLAFPAQADDKKITLSATTVLTTDYMFRSISNTEERPAAQAEFDLYYGIFYAGIWGSNTAYGDGIEIDYYAGITPKWGDITFNFAALYYSYPGADSEIGYFEAKAGASYTTGQWTFGINDYWSPDNFQVFGNSNAIEGSIAYAFKGKLFNFFSPTISGGLGFQSYEEVASDYTYWNAGLTLGFMTNFSIDARYYDTDYDEAECFIQSGGRNNCDARAVGTLKAVF